MNMKTLVFCFLLGKVSLASGLSVDEKCFQQSNQTVVLQYLDKVPFIQQSSLLDSVPEGFFVTIVQEALKRCCLATTNIKFVRTEMSSVGLQELMDSENFDLFMPVNAFSDSVKVRGSPYVNIADSSGVAVLMLANASGAKLLLSGLQAWPILVFIIVSALLAGVLIWLLERNGQLNQFSEEFCLGVFEGFWWAFCTMTTVGYGDRAPKTVVGKVLGSVWMLVGVIIVTMFISIITTSLTSASYGQYTCIRGMKVSVVNQSSEHIFAIRSSAQVFVSPNQQAAFDDMISRNVEASLIDTHALKYHIPSLSQKHVVVASVLENHISYGVALWKHGSSRLESCLKDFMDSNEVWRFELLRRAAGGKRVNVTPAEDYFGSGGIFSIFVYSGLAAFVVIFIVGLIWEYQKNRTKDQKAYHVNHKLSVQPTKTPTTVNKGVISNGTANPTIHSANTTTVGTRTPYRTKQRSKPTPPTPPQYHGATISDVHTANSTAVANRKIHRTYQRSNPLRPTPGLSNGNTPWEKLLTRQNMEVIELENEFYRFEKEWEKRYKDLQRTAERSYQC